MGLGKRNLLQIGLAKLLHLCIPKKKIRLMRLKKIYQRMVLKNLKMILSLDKKRIYLEDF